jgi:hypothetical protein
MQTDGGTDMKNLIFPFRNFGNTPKNIPYFVFILSFGPNVFLGTELDQLN